MRPRSGGGEQEDLLGAFLRSEDLGDEVDDGWTGRGGF